MRTKVFLDTNILVDLATDRQGTMASQVVLSMVKRQALEAQVTTQSILDTVYIAHRQGAAYEKVESLINEIRQYVNIGYIDSFSIKWALEHHSGDFEDAAQYEAAYSSSCDYYLTRDKGILSRTENANVMKAITPEGFMGLMMAQEN